MKILKETRNQSCFYKSKTYQLHRVNDILLNRIDNLEAKNKHLQNIYSLSPSELEEISAIRKNEVLILL